MNKNKLAAVITFVLCASVSSVSIADVYDVDICIAETNSIAKTCHSSEISIFQGDSVYVSVTKTGSGTVVDSGAVSIDPALDLNATTDSLLHFTADGDTNIKAPTCVSSVGDTFAVPTISKLNLNFSRSNGVLPVSGNSEGSCNVIGFNSIVEIPVSVIQC